MTPQESGQEEKTHRADEPWLLDLLDPQDRREALEEARDSEQLEEQHLEDYVQTVEELDLPGFWLTATNIGTIQIPISEDGKFGLPISQAVWAIQRLQRFRGSPGFDDMLNGFRNPPQVRDAIAELRAAELLEACPSTEQVEPGVRIEDSSGASCPDLSWETTDGSFNVEVKSMSPMETQRSAGLQRVSKSAQGTFDAWAGELDRIRIDILVSALGGGVTADIQTARDRLSEDLERDQPGNIVQEGSARVQLSSREEEPPGEAPVLRNGTVQVGPESTQIHPGHETHWLTVGTEIGGALRRQARRLLKRARKQLGPGEDPGVIFLETSFMGPVADYAEELLGEDAYAHTPLIIVSNGQEARYVYRAWNDPSGPKLEQVLEVLAVPSGNDPPGEESR